jgi:hypothetical protein
MKARVEKLRDAPLDYFAPDYNCHPTLVHSLSGPMVRDWA